MEESTVQISEPVEEIKEKPIENKPTPEDIEAAKKEFEDAVTKFNVSTWAISSEEDALDRANYLLDFVNNRLMWAKTAWMGVIKLNDELNTIIPKLKKGEIKVLEVPYQALEFILFVLDNPSGVGIDDAKIFEKEQPFFAPFYTDVSNKTEEARNAIKDIQWLQDKWSAASQGFFLVKEPEEEYELSNEEIKEMSGQEITE
jgi:hypothetical protein